jgi:thiol-disulfide isomerase/thioredoxin
LVTAAPVETPNELQILLLLLKGKSFLLRSLGKVTIVDFWASWCIVEENPNVVAIYKDLHSKGLNIVGVSLDKDAAKWKEAIAKINGRMFLI